MDNPPLEFDHIDYRRAIIDEIIQLRYDVLIVGTNRTSPEFDGDLEPTTYHFGAFSNFNTLCCLSLMRNDQDNTQAYQLRGMATDPQYQGHGIGGSLLRHAEETVWKETGIGFFWCNARLGIEDFYRNQGWDVISEPFMIEGVCMHVKMEKQYSS